MVELVFIGVVVGLMSLGPFSSAMIL